MSGEYLNLKIVLILSVGFAFASILGYLANRIKLSPILGYLVAGYFIGPYFPGFVADLTLSEQLAEIGVILMMFGVGLHFKLQDLINVRNIAIPGALGQTLIATLFGMALVYSIGWTLEAGVIFGLAIGVASTVVLVRMLTDNHLLHTPQGHISVGWLVVEDIITVIALLLVPPLAASMKGDGFSMLSLGLSIIFIIFKFLLFIGIMFTVGLKAVKYVLKKIMHTHSHELFTLTILALIFVIAVGSSVLFGTSIALGAFIAGMIIGQSDLRHQVSANALPLKDTFVVIFFLSVGMLFNPYAIVNHFTLFISTLAIILIVKPITAFLIAWGLKHPFHVALTVAIALMQIGEFSFILSEEAMRFDLIPDEGYDVIVACSLISIALNPLLFKLLPKSHK